MCAAISLLNPDNNVRQKFLATLGSFGHFLIVSLNATFNVIFVGIK